MVYCYTVMLFGLRNVGATYQQVMIVIFCDHRQKIVECYVDDIAIKSWNKEDHIKNLRIIFDLIRARKLKMKPTKSFLRVSHEKFLSFMVTSKGIHLDPDKINAMQYMKPPRNIKNLWDLQGRLAYIHCFIANLVRKYQFFSKLIKKGISFV